MGNHFFLPSCFPLDWIKKNYYAKTFWRQSKLPIVNRHLKELMCSVLVSNSKQTSIQSLIPANSSKQTTIVNSKVLHNLILVHITPSWKIKSRKLAKIFLTHHPNPPQKINFWSSIFCFIASHFLFPFCLDMFN